MLSWSRWLSVAVTLFGLSVITFAIPRLIPGDPVTVLAGERSLAPEERALLLRDLDLDRPLVVQYARYVGRLAHGDFGRSFISKRPVLEDFGARFPATLELSLLALALGVGLGLLGGYASALHPHRVADRVLSGAAVMLWATPVYLTGLVLVLLVSVRWVLTPVWGRIGIAYDIAPVTGFLLIDSVVSGKAGAFASAVRHLVLPVVTLAALPFAVVQRMTRTALLGELSEEYVRVARAKGASAARALGHAWRPALVPVIAAAAVIASQLVGGAVLTEYVFGWPGVGRWLVEATQRRDYAVLQAALLLIGILVILVGLAADGLQRAADPRVGRHRAQS